MNKFFNLTLLVLFTIICIYFLIKSCNYKELFANQDNVIQYPFNLTDTINNLTNDLNDKISKEVAIMNNKVSDANKSVIDINNILDVMKNNFTAPVANIDILTSPSANINNLTSQSAKINTLNSNVGNFSTLSSLSGNINNLTTNNLLFGANGLITNLSNLNVNNITLSQNGSINNVNGLKLNNLTTTSLLSNNLTTTSLLSTNLTTTSLLSTNGQINNLTSTSLFFGANGLITNLSNLYVNNITLAQNGNINNVSGLKLNNLTTTSLLSTNLTTTSLLSTNLTTTSLLSTNGVINNLTSTSLLSTNGVINNLTSTSLLSTNANINNLTSTSLLSTNGVINNLTSTSGIINNLTSTNGVINNLTSTSLLSNNAIFNNLTSPGAVIDNVKSNNINAINITGVNSDLNKINANQITSFSLLVSNNLSAPSSNVDTLNIGTFNFKQTVKDNKKTLELKQGENILATFTSDDNNRIKLYTDNTNNISINKATDGVNYTFNNLVTGTQGSGYTLNGNLNINGTLKVGNNITIKSDNNGDVINVGSGTTATNGKTRINIGKYSLVPNLSGSDDYIELRYNKDGGATNEKLIGKFSKDAGDKAVIYTNDNSSNYFYVNNEPSLGMYNNTQGASGWIGNIKTQGVFTNDVKNLNGGFVIRGLDNSETKLCDGSADCTKYIYVRNNENTSGFYKKTNEDTTFKIHSSGGDSGKLILKTIQSSDVSANRYNINGTNSKNYNIRDDGGIFTLFSDNKKLMRYKLPSIWNNTGDVLSVRLNDLGSRHMYAKPSEVRVGDLDDLNKRN